MKRPNPRFRLALTCVIALLLNGLFAGPAPAALTSRALDGVAMRMPETRAVQDALARVPADAAGRAPTRLAAIVPLDAGLDDGTWTTEGATAVWRLRLYSAGAKVMIAHLDPLVLPAGAELRWMSPDGAVVHGPYTRDDGRPAKELWTPFVRGEEALLELRVPTSARDAVRLHIAHVGHGLLDPMAKSTVSPKSGSCNIDVVCTQGDAWRDSIRAVARIQIPSTQSGFVNLCSGTLMNDVPQDSSPLFLTANHCGLTSSNASGTVVYFNYQTSVCAGAPDGSEAQNITGSTFLVAGARADFTLVRLSRTPPSAFNVHYAGFDANSSDTPSCGAAIHHPNGDEKRISLFDTAPTRTTVNLEEVSTQVQAFAVHWAQGTTEGGSSGGGLLNPSRQVVGVLSGGDADCTNQGGTDFFARLDVAWGDGLKTFLDPGNTGALTLCGHDAGATCDPSAAITPACGSTTGGGSSSGSSDDHHHGGGGAFAPLALMPLLLAGAWIRLRRRHTPG